MMASAPPPAVYAGIREIATTGTWYRELAPLRYDVTERYSTVRWRGRVATLRATTAYAAVTPPANGIVLTSETLDQDERVEANGSVRLLSYRRVTHAANLQSGGSSIRSSADVRTIEVTFMGGATTIPASLTPHRETLPLAAVMRRTELETGTFGTSAVAGTSAESDVRRTTAPDGSFEESGNVSFQPSSHSISQHADGSAKAYDGTPGFGMRDVTVAAPEGTGPDAHIAVTIKSQGRTIGPTPIDTNDYVMPVWYAATWPAPLATASLTVEARRTADARCVLGSARIIPVVIERRHVDVTGEIVEERDERDLDASRGVLCRLTSTTTHRFDVPGGNETGTINDTTVVHVPGHPARV